VSNSSLFYAVKNGNLEAVRRELTEGIALDVRDDYNHTVYYYALESDRADILKALFAADRPEKIQTRVTPDMIVRAASRGYNQALAALIEKGFSMNSTRDSADTPLIAAARAGHFETVRLLLDARADVNFQGENANTALLLAASNGHYEVVRQLIAARVALDLQNRGGDTALTLAVNNGQINVVRELLKAGASPYIVNAGGNNAFALAKSRGRKDILQALQEYQQHPEGSWSQTGPQEITRLRSVRNGTMELTESFNFVEHERLTVMQLDGRPVSHAFTPFRDIDPATIRTAAEALRKKGVIVLPDRPAGTPPPAPRLF
jgi:ankyrin repeat protein